jgi:hypothetical protein
MDTESVPKNDLSQRCARGESVVSELAGSVAAHSARRAALHASEFKIPAGPATQLAATLRIRVMWHRVVAAILMLAALLAIGGGIALIFYAGELAKQQRAANVDSLIERANELSKKADTIRADADDKLREYQQLGKRGRSSTLLGACRLVPNVVRDGGGRHGEARFAGGGYSYDGSYVRSNAWAPR